MSQQNFMFAEFQHDATTYAEAKEFWRRLWEDLDPLARAGWQSPWFSSRPESLEDGNPIFTAISKLKRRGVRIIQFPPSENQPPLQSWTNWFGGRENQEAVLELVIGCTLSTDLLPVLAPMIESWIEHGRVRLVYDRTPVQSYSHESAVPQATSFTPVAA